MSYENILFSSDLDAFRSNGEEYTASITFSGTLGGGTTQTQTTSITVDAPDFYQVLYDNSIQHSGGYRDMSLEDVTFVVETTTPIELSAQLSVSISGDTVTFTGIVFNAISSSVSLQTTTINFRFIAYESTLI